MLSPLPTKVQVRHFHMFCGLGGGAVGFQRGHARVGNLVAEMRCVGGIDSDPQAVVDFSRSVGVRATYLDLFDREQYAAWHGKAPPPQWREAGPDDVRRAVIGGGTPHIVFASSPCKGVSGLQNPERGASPKYQALNRLTLRGIWLMIQAFESDPVPLVILENVPRIQTTGRDLLDQIDLLLECAGYAVTHTVHDAGALGGLAQHRKRFLLVARHKGKVPAFLYEAPQRRVRAVGEVIGPMPLPDCGERIHRLPRIEWRTWMRLALVQAGGDWRSLQDLDVGADGMVRGLRLLYQDDAGSVIADPRTPNWTSERTGRVSAYQQYGVQPWGEAGHTVTGQAAPGAGPFSVADPRLTSGQPGSDSRALATGRFNDVYRVVPWDEAAGCVTGATGNARPNIADPRPGTWRDGRKTWQAGGHYGVVRWDRSSPTVTGNGQHDNGYSSVADPRVALGPAHESTYKSKRAPLVIALDGTWHRPFTTLELCALQGFDWEFLLGRGLCGGSESGWRERIGNAVPPPAAEAIASTMAETLLMVAAGVSTPIGSTPIWVRGLTTAISVSQ